MNDPNASLKAMDKAIAERAKAAPAAAPVNDAEDVRELSSSAAASVGQQRERDIVSRVMERKGIKPQQRAVARALLVDFAAVHGIQDDQGWSANEAQAAEYVDLGLRSSGITARDPTKQQRDDNLDKSKWSDRRWLDYMQSKGIRRSYG